MATAVIADAGPLVALLDRREEHHAWASDDVRQMAPPLWTCGAVLSEACFLLAGQSGSIARLRALVSAGHILSAEEDPKHWNRALALMDRYANVPTSFADACLVALAESLPGAAIFTLDRDFQIYRQHGERPMELIAPFAG